jgi:hypothetical protein
LNPVVLQFSHASKGIRLAITYALHGGLFAISVLRPRPSSGPALEPVGSSLQCSAAACRTIGFPSRLRWNSTIFQLQSTVSTLQISLKNPGQGECARLRLYANGTSGQVPGCAVRVIPANLANPLQGATTYHESKTPCPLVSPGSLSFS